MTLATVEDVMLPHPVPVRGMHHETADTFTVTLDVSGRPGGFHFQPGQFNMLSMHGIGEVPISISGDPSRPNELVHTIRAVGGVTRPMAGIKRGAVMGVRGPYGAGWPLDAARGRDLVLLAGGIGLAPLRPVIYEAVRRRGEFDRVIVLYGARTPGDLLFGKELERWRGRFDTTVLVTTDRGQSDWHGYVGVVTSLLARVRFDPYDSVAMLCGPEVMLRFAARDLRALGMTGERIFVSMERNMRCGVGLCGHCQVGPHFVCKDGPVFALDRVARLLEIKEV